MSRTLELRKQLQTIFKTVTNNVHFEIAPDTSSYPYLVYDFSELTNNYDKAVFQMEANLLDYGSDTTTIENLADTLQELLNKYYFINDKIQFNVYRLSRSTIQEEDKKIRRRRLLFEIQLHELKEE